MKPVPKLDVTVNLSRNPGEDQDIEAVKEVVCKLRKDWTKGNLDAKVLSGGNINGIVKVVPLDGDDKDAVIVKIHSNNTKVREDRDTMVLVMRIAEAGGVGVPVLGEFNNGFVYKFTPGEVMVPDAIPHDNRIQRKIAHELARFHNLKLEEILSKDELSLLPREPRMFKDIYNFLSLVPEDLAKLTWGTSTLEMTREEVQSELSWVEEELTGCDDELVFCHNDCWWPNMIYDRENDKVNFIDLDFANYNYSTRDIVNYFMHGRAELIPNSFFRMHMFRESEKRTFIRMYLEKRKELEAGDSGKADNVTDAEVERLYVIAKKMELGMILDRLAICLFLTNQKFPLDYIWCANLKWDHYHAMKKEYLNLKKLKML